MEQAKPPPLYVKDGQGLCLTHATYIQQSNAPLFYGWLMSYVYSMHTEPFIYRELQNKHDISRTKAFLSNSANWKSRKTGENEAGMFNLSYITN